MSIKFPFFLCWCQSIILEPKKIPFSIVDVNQSSILDSEDTNHLSISFHICCILFSFHVHCSKKRNNNKSLIILDSPSIPMPSSAPTVFPLYMYFIYLLIMVHFPLRTIDHISQSTLIDKCPDYLSYFIDVYHIHIRFSKN